jgi:thioredoxin-related protein
MRSIKSILVVAVLVSLFTVRTDAAAWETDFARASEAAAKQGRYMLLNFTGSDWCGWCVKLDKEVFSRNDFKSYAKSNLVCMVVDFPRSKGQSKKLKAQNSQLAQKYSIKGYPSILILSPEGALVGRTGYKDGGAKAYVQHLKDIIGKHEAQQGGGE